MSLLITRFYLFGDFTLDIDQRVLLREGKPVPLTPKVFDTLLILVENSGQIVEKEELMRRLWPNTFVEEGNLTVNIQQLRKSLNDDARDPRYVGTVARRGYRFITDVEAVLDDKTTAGSQSVRGFETSDADALSPAAVNAIIDQIEAQQSEPEAVSSSNESQSSPGERDFKVISAADKRSTGAGRKSIAVAAALIFLAVVGLVFWKFSNASKGNSGDERRADGKIPMGSPVKLERLTATGQSYHVALSPDGKYLAYTRVFDKKVAIWMRQFATNTNVEIVPASDIIFGLAFANSGDYLYFVKGEPAALYRVSLLGGLPAKVVDNLEGDVPHPSYPGRRNREVPFSVSPDDRQIAFIRQAINRDGQRECSLVIANSDGTSERNVLTAIHPERMDTVLWSPGGEAIICGNGNSSVGNQNATIVEVRIADGEKKELSPFRFFQISKLAWLPHGSGLIMCARRNAADNNQLWRVSYPAMEISQITEGVNSFGDLSLTADADKAAASQTSRISEIWVGSSREPKSLRKITQATENFCWTANGRVVYSSMASGNRDLWIMQPDGSEQRQLTVNPGKDSTPAVTPDNRYVVFISNRSGSYQVWRMNLDGSNQIKITDGAAKNFPSVSVDGKWVFYNTNEDWHLWRVSIDGGEPARLTDYTACYPTLSPDGKFIACAGRTEPKRELSILILPVEGGPPLKRIEFPGGSFSGTRIKWTPDSKALVCAAELNGSTVIIRQPLAGGQREEIARFDIGALNDFGYSADGQFLAVTLDAWQNDIVLIGGLNR